MICGIVIWKFQVAEAIQCQMQTMTCCRAGRHAAACSIPHNKPPLWAKGQTQEETEDGRHSKEITSIIITGSYLTIL